MSGEDTARIFYESARTEMIERIGLRDNVLILYLGVVGALYGVALGTSTSLLVLLVVPYMALGAAMILSQHHAVIGQIGFYVTNELHQFFKPDGKCGCPPQWETSTSRASYHRTAMLQRFWGHLFLIVVPAIPALLFTRPLALKPWSPEAVLWWSGCVFAVLTAWVIVEVHLLRKTLAKKRQQAGRCR